MNVRNGLIAAVIAVLAVVAILGWTRGHSTQAAPTPLSYGQSANYDTNGKGSAFPNASNAYDYSNAGPAAYPQAPPETYINVIPRPVVVQQPPPPAPVYEQGPPVVQERAFVEPRPGVARERVYVEERDGHHHHRSTKKSVAIVAGSAGAGAAIGALAGGGKGAGIGALAGGAGGFIYDRLTHNH